jgi:hypothetical protein
MKKPYFVMIYVSSRESAWPMENKWTDVAFFGSEEAARKAAHANSTAVKWGFEILKMGMIP